MDKPEALRLAAELEAPVGTQSTYSAMQQAAAELRRLQAEYETLKKSVATAWNRGHTMGMRANEDIARQALEVVKKDAWANTQLTEALLKAEEQCDALTEANEAFSKREHWWNEKMFTLEQQRDALLEALERYQVKRQDFDRFADEITALRAALAQQEQEPTVFEELKALCAQWDDSLPPRRAWRGLTDVEWMNIVNKNHAWFGTRPDEVAHEVCKLTETKLKEKNA
jgi:chromosome segregation ATPase